MNERKPYHLELPEGYTPEEEAALRAHPAFLHLSALVEECNKAHDAYEAAHIAVERAREQIETAYEAAVDPGPRKALKAARAKRVQEVRRAKLAAFLAGYAYVETPEQWANQEKALLRAVGEARDRATAQCLPLHNAAEAAYDGRTLSAEKFNERDAQLRKVYHSTLQGLVILHCDGETLL